MAQLPPSDKINEDELRARVGDLAYDVLRNQGTERPFTSELSAKFDKGHYYCAACGHHLFTSDEKFDAGCGWPSFMTPVSDDALTTHKDISHGMVRLEVRCANCGSHQGHVFDDGPGPTGQRYCINGVAIAFRKG
jgi:peptide-methionine (R)-S-oxide reductase